LLSIRDERQDMICPLVAPLLLYYYWFGA